MPALAEELVARGVDLWLELEDEAERDEVLDLLLRWLGGEQLTERADEPELRLNAAEEALELFGENVPSLHRFHALAVLALPPGNERRDAAEAIAELWEHLDVTQDDPEETIRTIAALLDAGARDEGLLDEGDELIAEADPGGISLCRLAAEAFCAARHVEAREAGDDAEAARWAERHAAYLAADEGEGLGALAGRASQLDMAGDWEEAVELYREVVEGS